MKKFLTSLAIVGICFLLTACGGKKEEDKLAAIKESGVLKVGTSAEFAPFEFHTMVDGKDKIVGADMDLAQALADKLGVKLKIEDMEFNAVLATLKEGKVDLGIAGISATPERQKSFDFSANYYNPSQKVVINKKNAANYNSIASLKGKKIGAQKGSIQEDIVKEQMQDPQIVSVAKVPNLILEVKQGSIDALVVEETVGAAYIAQNPELQFATIDLKSSEDEAYAIAMQKGSDTLKSEIDKIIKELIDSGEIEKYVNENTAIANKTTKE